MGSMGYHEGGTLRKTDWSEFVSPSVERTSHVKRAHAYSFPLPDPQKPIDEVYPEKSEFEMPTCRSMFRNMMTFEPTDVPIPGPRIRTINTAFHGKTSPDYEKRSK
jgi:hypothetical protein